MEDRVKELLERMNKSRGYTRLWRELLAYKDIDFTELNNNTSDHVFNKRNALPRKFKEILCVCLDAYTFYEAGLRIHIRGALEAGATEEEIVEALEVTSLLGIHPVAFSMPILDEVLKSKKEGDVSKSIA